MGYTTYLWWFGGLFIIVLTTLVATNWASAQFSGPFHSETKAHSFRWDRSN